MLLMAVMLWGCDKEEKVYDSALTQFETPASYQLL